MHARENLQDVLALLRCWRQGPRGDGHVRVGQVFEQQVPGRRFWVEERFETAWHEARRHHGRNVPVERNLLAARIPSAAGAFWKSSLDDDRAGGAAGIAVIDQAKPDDARQQRRPRAFHGDVTDSSIPECAASAQRLRQTRRLRYARQDFGHQGLLNLWPPIVVPARQLPTPTR